MSLSWKLKVCLNRVLNLFFGTNIRSKDSQMADTDGQTQPTDVAPEGSVTSGDQQTGNEEANEGINDNETEQRNGDENAEEDEDDFFAMIYGQNEDNDNDSDNDDEREPIAEDVISSANKISGKRRSQENDNQFNKRIKAEPNEPQKNKPKEQTLTTTIEAVETEEVIAPEIPKSSFQFMSYLLDLNANNLEGIEHDLSNFSMSRNLRDITNQLTFNDLNTFREAFIPYIICNLWLKLKLVYNKKSRNFATASSSKRFLSILTKLKTDKIGDKKEKKGLEMKCINIVRQKESPVFKFGQLITIQTAVQAKPGSSKHIFTRRKYFCYITSHVIRNLNSENQSECNLVRLLNENKKDAIYIEEITFMTKYSDELYFRNDALLAAEPIGCVHNHHLEHRTVIKFDAFPLYKQIFNPIYSTKASGLSASINERRFDEKQKNIIQIALDVVGSPHGSSFLAINGSKDSDKTTILSEIVRQIVICPHLKQKKVLFCSSNSSTLETVNKYLRSRKIKTYIVGNGFNDSLKEIAIKYIEHKLEKESDEKIKELYEDLIRHFDTGSQLPVESAVLKYSSIEEKSRLEAMKSCPVIMGRIDDLCNDISFYKYFTSNPLFNCCVIDDSTLVPEPQLYSLFSFHIPKFIFGGDISQADDDQPPVFREYGLSRSFFERYYLLHNQNQFQYQTTVFDV